MKRSNTTFFQRHFDRHVFEILKGSITTFILKIIGAGFRFLRSVLVARLLGANGVGIFFLALTISNLAVVVGRFGLDNVLLRYVASNYAINNWSGIKGIYTRGIGVSIIISFTVAVFMGAFSPFFAEFVFHEIELTLPFLIVSCSIPPMVLVFLFGELLKGIRQIRNSQLVQGVGVPVFSLLLILLLGNRYGVFGILLAYVVSTIMTALLGWGLWISDTPQLKGVKAVSPMQQIFSDSIPLLFVSISEACIEWTGIIALGICGSKTEIGILGVVLRISMLTSFILSSINSIAAPKFASMFSKNQYEDIGRIARFTTKLMILFATPILIVLIIFPEMILEIFGSEFVSGAPALIIISVGQFINVSTGSVGFLLMMSGNEHSLKRIVLFAATFNIVLTTILVPFYGVNGVAFSVATTLAVSNALKVYTVWKKTGVWALPIFNPKIA